MELTGSKKNSPKNISASYAPVEPRKRKKDGMEGAEAQETSRPRLELGWDQTDEEVSIRTRIEAKEGDIENVEVSFTERQMTITLPSGQQQTWHFHGAIDEMRSRVVRSKRKFNMTVVKKELGTWPSLEAAEQPGEESGYSEEEEQQEVEEEQGEESPEMISPNGDMTDSMQELRTKEEEPVLNLNHIKHDFFERDDTLTIHVYVKNINKDVVKIHFDKQSFTVKFQTGDAKFLQLHEGSSEETVFCWTVSTKSTIVPGECRWKATNTYIELKLQKCSSERWSHLEAPLRKETNAVPNKSTSWMPAKQSTALPSMSKASSTISSSSGGDAGAGAASVVFDEMSQQDDNRRGFESIDVSSLSQIPSAGMKSQKPMAKVHPLSSQAMCSEQRVGFTGLDNLGNTCYLNSVVQILANTPELRDYFMGGQYKADINTQTGGELARCFAMLLKMLWKGNLKFTSANRLKDLVSKRGSSFSGFYQHDAQEFLSYLLDGLHEDVNRAKKPITTSQTSIAAVKEAQEEKGGPSTEGDSLEKNTTQKEVAQDDSRKPVHVIAEEKWTDHRKREDSFLVDLMYGQYKNKITCPSCKEVSTTFDPFSILPLALPKNKKILTITFMWRDAQRKPIKYQVKLVKGSTVEHLTEALSHRTGVQPKNMRVFEVKNRLFYKRFETNSDLTFVGPRDLIIVSEVLSAVDAGEEVVEIEVIQRILHVPFPVSCAACKQVCQSDRKLKRCTSCLKVGYCDQKCQRSHWSSHRQHCNKGPDPVGCPFILSLPRSHCTYPRIARLMESFARYSVDVFQPPVRPDSATPTTTSSPSISTPLPPTTSTLTPTSTPPKIISSGTAGSGSMPPPVPPLPPSCIDGHLPSRASGSNLSNSSGSQSSGSLSSLDSISSCSSTATLTADTAHVATFDIGHSGGEEDEEGEEGKEAYRDQRGGGDVDSGLGSITSLQSQAPSTSTQGDWRPETDQEKDWAGAASAERGGSNVQSVAASMSQDRSVSLFFIKPVDVDGRGKRVDRLDDKGDMVLDMRDNKQLSMDWRNNDSQPFYVLVQSKDLEAEEDDSVKTPQMYSETLNLQQCLDMYHEPEVLSDKNAWTCEKCKSKQEALKQCFLWKIPHIVIIQLKRFTSFDLFTRKIDTRVDFPIRGLDLTPYKYHHNPEEPPALYDLYGVINHIGHTAIGGHYTCRARCADPNTPFSNEVGWRLFDDSVVSVVNNEKSVVDQNAYVLFYRRRQAFIPPAPLVRHVTVTDAAPPVQPKKDDDVIKEKSEEESLKETEKRKRGSPTVVKLNGDPASSEAVLDDNEEENYEEKQDSEKDGDSSEGGDDHLVIDMEDSNSQDLGYTDMDAVD